MKSNASASAEFWKAAPAWKNSRAWKPKNYDLEGFRGPIRLRTALALSINTVAIRVMAAVTPERVIELVHSLGIDEELPAELSLALGSGVVTPLEHVNAFAVDSVQGLGEIVAFQQDAADFFGSIDPNRTSYRILVLLLCDLRGAAHVARHALCTSIHSARSPYAETMPTRIQWVVINNW